MNQILGKKDLSSYNLSILEDWLLGKIIYNVFNEFYANEYDAEKHYLTLRVLLSKPTWCSQAKTDSENAVKELFSNDAVQKLLHFNRYQEILYFNAENFEELLKILFLNNLLLQSDKKITANNYFDGLAIIKWVGKAAKSAGYRVSDVVEYL